MLPNEMLDVLAGILIPNDFKYFLCFSVMLCGSLTSWESYALLRYFGLISLMQPNLYILQIDILKGT